MARRKRGRGEHTEEEMKPVTCVLSMMGPAGNLNGSGWMP